jgi:hypothetical protein
MSRGVAPAAAASCQVCARCHVSTLHRVEVAAEAVWEAGAMACSPVSVQGRGIVMLGLSRVVQGKVWGRGRGSIVASWIVVRCLSHLLLVQHCRTV